MRDLKNIISSDSDQIISSIVDLYKSLELLRAENALLKSSLKCGESGLNIQEVVLGGKRFVRCPEHDSFPLFRQNYSSIKGETMCFTKQELLSNNWEAVDSPQGGK